MPRKLRQSFSMSRDQLTWLRDALMAAQRGADLRVMMRSGQSQSVLQMVIRAAQHIGTVRPTRHRTHCKRGHEYTKENTYMFPGGQRRCIACHNAGQKSLRARRREEDAVLDKMLGIESERVA